MSKQESSQKNTPLEQMILNTTIFYGAMAAIALLVIHFEYKGLESLFSWDSSEFSTAQMLSLAGLSVGVLLIAQYLLEDFFLSFKIYRTALIQQVGSIDAKVGIYLVVTAATAQELLFQGAILPEVGPFFTAVLFTLVHPGPRHTLGPWTILTFISGLIFAWMYAVTSSLWPSLLGHTGLRVINFLCQRHAFKKFMEELHKQGSPQKASDNKRI